jgi:hypothetical protein
MPPTAWNLPRKPLCQAAPALFRSDLPPFKIHSGEVPNRFLQVAVSKTLRRARCGRISSLISPERFRYSSKTSGPKFRVPTTTPASDIDANHRQTRASPVRVHGVGRILPIVSSVQGLANQEEKTCSTRLRVASSTSRDSFSVMLWPWRNLLAVLLTVCATSTMQSSSNPCRLAVSIKDSRAVSIGPCHVLAAAPLELPPGRLGPAPRKRHEIRIASTLYSRPDT